MQGKQQKFSPCTNCGLVGHHYRHCTEPVTSYGIIAFRKKGGMPQANEIAKTEANYHLSTSDLEFLLIQRRDSIGFVELLRAKYKLTDIDYIVQQISGTTIEERRALTSKTFRDLWIGLWGTSTNESRQHKQEYEQAKVKFEQLVQGLDVDGKWITLQGLLDSTPVLWDSPEWGFPKGRRNPGETDLECAAREFTEETGIGRQQFRVLENVQPLNETFFGNNSIHYRHVYYLGWVPASVHVQMQSLHESMTREIGNIGWFTFEDAVARIRSTNSEKRQVLANAQSILKTICPLLIGPVGE